MAVQAIGASAAYAGEAATGGLSLFGQRGHLVIGEIIGFESVSPYVSGFAGYTRSSTPFISGTGRQNYESLWFSPAADYFLTDRVTLGGLLSVTLVDQKLAESSGFSSRLKSYAVSVLPRLGYVVPLGRGIAFWPRIGIGAGFGGANQHINDSSSKNSTLQLAGSISAPLVFTLTERIILKFGPVMTAGTNRTKDKDSGESANGSALRVSVASHFGVVF